MGNKKTLGKPFTSDQNREKAAENGRKGGIASGIAKREKKLWKEELIKRLNAKDWDEIIDKLIDNAKNNGGKDFEILRDTMGQKPVDKEEVDNTTRINIIDDTTEG